jgi:hypothetical protein
MRLLVFLALCAPIVFMATRVQRGGLPFRLRIHQVMHGLANQYGEVALLDDLQTQFDRVVKQATDVAEKASAEGRDLNEAERPLVKQWIDEAKGLKSKIAEAKADGDLLGQIRDFEKSIAGGDGPRAVSKGSMGQRFVKDADLVAYLKGVIPNGGYIGEKTRIQSPAVQFNGIGDMFGRKDILSSGDPDAGPGTLVVPDFRGLLDIGTWMRPLVLRDIIGSGTTGSDTINYARIIDVTNNAAAVPEASGTSAGDASGDVTGTKPESSMDFERVEDTVKTLAHWLPITKRALADAGQVRTIADNFLQYGLEEQLEDQMISGDGTGENFEGILTVSGTQSQAWSTNILETIRKAKTKAVKVGRILNPSVLISPEDKETIDLQHDSQNRYYGNGPFGTGPDTLWGMPTVVSESVPVGTGIVGGFNWAVLYDRQQAAVMLSDSHEDFFVRNLVAILAELRAGFGIIRPKAFVIIDLTA